MKKFLMVLAFAGVSVAGMAQEDAASLKYSVATNSFWSNWFISADLSYGAFYTNEEKGNDFSRVCSRTSVVTLVLLLLLVSGSLLVWDFAQRLLVSGVATYSLRMLVTMPLSS